MWQLNQSLDGGQGAAVPAPSATGLQDRFARRFGYLRLSLTEVCNFRCSYCLPEGYRPADGKRPGFLGRDELLRVARAFVALGTTKIRLTGGEPSLRRDLTEIIADLAAQPQAPRLALTTNGYRLQAQAAAWRQAGLSQLNVSIDSLDPREFALITGDSRLPQILDGLEAAWAAGFGTIKVNTVLLKGLNDHALGNFLAWIRDKPIQLRFIELMQTGQRQAYFDRHHLDGTSLLASLLNQGWQPVPRSVDDGPAQVLRHPDYVGELGFILPYSPDFCASCNRLRVSASGQLHLCLFGDGGIDLRDLLQADAQQAALMRRLQQALQHKALAHRLHQGNAGVREHLASIGG